MPPKPDREPPSMDDVRNLGMRPPDEWFAKVTVPLIEEFIADPVALHRTVSAVREVFHFHQRLWWYWFAIDIAHVHDTPTVKDFLTKLKSRSDAFQALEAAANATKHHVRDQVRCHPRWVQVYGPPDGFPHVVATATRIHRTIGEGGPDTLATILDAMTVYRTYL